MTVGDAFKKQALKKDISFFLNAHKNTLQKREYEPSV